MVRQCSRDRGSRGAEGSTAIMADPRVLILAGRGSSGSFMHNGPPHFGICSSFPSNDTKLRTQAFSQDGKSFAVSSGQSVTVMDMSSFAVRHELACQRVSCLQFSPLGKLLATWELYVGNKEAPQQSCNLRIWDVSTGNCVKAFHQKKQVGWEPQWSDDEVLVSRNVNNEVHFFENNCFDVIVKKLYIQKVQEYKLASGKAPYHIICYIPGTKGQPSAVKVFKYPNFEGNSAVIASKSFFKADKVDMKWNGKGTAVLVLSSLDADKSGSSYYGEQKLHLLTTSGDSGFVQLAKEGPVYSFEWNPSSLEFCVVYGFMPAKATLYSSKGEPTFDFGTSPRNLVYYNTFGNILILAGFGNLNGHVEIWDLRQKKEIVRTHARDTTFLEWCPNGEHFLTATLSPRLRVGNGYKIWHYTGSLIHEFAVAKDEELWELTWQPHPRGSFTESKIIYIPVPSIAPSKPEASKEVYRPPAARGLANSFKIHDEYEQPSDLKKPSNQGQMSKQAAKNKKKRDAKKAKKEQETPQEHVPAAVVQAEEVQLLTAKLAASEVDPDLEKKTRNLLKKLDAIKKLKELQATGKTLEANQIEKINKEAELLQELEELGI